jgi:hypothetical protein
VKEARAGKRNSGKEWLKGKYKGEYINSANENNNNNNNKNKNI